IPSMCRCAKVIASCLRIWLCIRWSKPIRSTAWRSPPLSGGTRTAIAFWCAGLAMRILRNGFPDQGAGQPRGDPEAVRLFLLSGLLQQALRVNGGGGTAKALELLGKSVCVAVAESLRHRLNWFALQQHHLRGGHASALP